MQSSPGWAPDTQALGLAGPCPPVGSRGLCSPIQTLPPGSPPQKQLSLTMLTGCRSPGRKRQGGRRKGAGGQWPGVAQEEGWSGPVPRSPSRHGGSEVGRWGAGDRHLVSGEQGDEAFCTTSTQGWAHNLEQNLPTSSRGAPRPPCPIA